LQQVAEDLGVRYVLEGSMQKSGDRIRVTAQLIDTLAGRQLWSEKYDKEMKNFFQIQDKITHKIVVALQGIY
jgi:TolB-like protein